MREIKFRGIINETCLGKELPKKFVIGSLINEIKNDITWIIDEVGTRWHVNKETICQFTGLIDKNNKELFKDDLFTDGKNNYRVYATKGGFSHSLPQFKSTYLGTSPYPLQSLSDEQTVSWFEYNCEIIGNVHENPELLV